MMSQHSGQREERELGVKSGSLYLQFSPEWPLIYLPGFYILYTAILIKVVGKGARDNPERHCGWF